MGQKKRRLDFRSGEDVLAEIERLRTGGYVATKNWNLSQICEHLTKTMEGEMTGLGFRFPWLFRKTAGPLLTLWVLRTRSMPSVPTLPSLQPAAAEGMDDSKIIDDCVETVRKAEAFSGNLDDYPFVDGLTADRWRQIMWVHAAHHLGFLMPDQRRALSAKALSDSMSPG